MSNDWQGVKSGIQSGVLPSNVTRVYVTCTAIDAIFLAVMVYVACFVAFATGVQSRAAEDEANKGNMSLLERAVSSSKVGMQVVIGVVAIAGIIGGTTAVKTKLLAMQRINITGKVADTAGWFAKDLPVPLGLRLTLIDGCYAATAVGAIVAFMLGWRANLTKDSVETSEAAL